MEKLVLLYECGDGCSWSSTDTIPFEYESKEKAEYDLLEIWEKYAKDSIILREYHEKEYPTGRAKGKIWENKWDKYNKNMPKSPDSSIIFAGIHLYLGYLTLDYRNGIKKELGFKYSEPTILKLDDWFEQYKNNF